MSDRQRFLGGLEPEDRETFTKLYDRAIRAERLAAAAFGDFLSMDAVSRLMQREKYLPDVRLTLFGGYADAERKMAGFNASEEDFPLVPLEISAKASGGLAHRDCLGSLMGLGIERRKLGDIIILPEAAVVMLHSDIADYVETALFSVGRQSVSVRRAKLSELSLSSRGFTEISGTVASLRLDSITAMLIGKGRGAACDSIRAGRVFVNGISAEKADMKINDGDIVTVRGFGKAAVEVGGRSKKDRIFVALKKYA